MTTINLNSETYQLTFLYNLMLEADTTQCLEQNI